MSGLGEGFVRGSKRLLLTGAIAAAGVFVLAGGGWTNASAAGPLFPTFASAQGRAPSLESPERRAVPAPAAAPGARNPVFSPDSRLPEVEPPVSSGPYEEALSPLRSMLSSNPCAICIEGSTFVQWLGNSGYFTVDKVKNYRAGGVSGTLKLQMKLADTYPVWGNTITSFDFSAADILGTLAAGYYFSGINSGTTTFATNIPTGTYYLLWMVSEYDAGIYHYEDFVVSSKTVSCTSGVGCTMNNGDPTPGGSCTPDSTTLCLHGSRFKVQSDYMDYSYYSGTGKAQYLTDDSGYFWFSSSSNVELVCKMVSFCNGSSGNYGFYASGLTDVQATFKVTDTRNGTYRTYTNALGHRFTTIADGPFTCP